MYSIGGYGSVIRDSKTPNTCSADLNTDIEPGEKSSRDSEASLPLPETAGIPEARIDANPTETLQSQTIFFADLTRGSGYRTIRPEEDPEALPTLWKGIFQIKDLRGESSADGSCTDGNNSCDETDEYNHVDGEVTERGSSI